MLVFTLVGMEGAADVLVGPPKLLSNASLRGIGRCPPPTFLDLKAPGNAYCPVNVRDETK
jgi:hypothetical protein